jgi:hypothetical protein
MLRRAMLSTSGLVAAGAILAACSTTSTPSSTVPAQIIADTSGALQGILNVIPALVTDKVLTQAQATPLLTAVQEAMTYLAGVGPDTPAQAGATVLAQVAGYVNTALGILTSLPIPSPYSVIVIAAAVVVPELEAYIASVLPAPVAPAPAPAAARAARVSHGMSLAKAREVLHVKASD